MSTVVEPAASPQPRRTGPDLLEDGHRTRPAGLAVPADRLQPRVQQCAGAGARVLPVGRRAVPARQHLHRAGGRRPRQLLRLDDVRAAQWSHPAHRRRLHDQLARAAAVARARRQHRLVHGRDLRRADLRLFHGDVRAVAGARRHRRRDGQRHRLQVEHVLRGRPPHRRLPRHARRHRAHERAGLPRHAADHEGLHLAGADRRDRLPDRRRDPALHEPRLVRPPRRPGRRRGHVRQDRGRGRPEPAPEQGRLRHAQHDRRHLLRAHDHDLRLLGRVPVLGVQGRRAPQAAADGDVDGRHRQRARS